MADLQNPQIEGEGKPELVQFSDLIIDDKRLRPLDEDTVAEYATR